MAEFFLEKLFAIGSPTDVFTIWDVLIVLSLSFVLSIIIARTYQSTHRGVSYSQSFVHTLVIVGVVVSAIMLIVGSNIARAFTLLGALSIVRFRNAIKDTRDVGFIFLVMAVGMACGTKFYFMAVIMALAISLMVVLMTRYNFGSKKVSEDLLKIHFPADSDYDRLLKPTFDKYLDAYSLVSIDGIDEKTSELSFVVSFKKKGTANSFIDSLKKTNSNKKVQIIHGEHTIDV